MTQEAQKNEEFNDKSVATEEQPESQTEQVTSEAVEDSESQKYKEKYYYLAAEYENALKRFEREKSNIVKFGSENILRDVLGSIDLFELTVNALVNEQDAKIKNITVGLEMIRKQMIDSLSRHGLERVSALNSPFDPNLHEAVAQEVKADVAENTVIKEHQAGYKLNGRLLRAAKVVVSKKN
jgi:molecular chaperone GrpE